jgi:hypothetical protein
MLVADQFSGYVRAYAVRYHWLPGMADFRRIDLDNGNAPLHDATADVSAAIEAIEHLENSRAFARDSTFLAKPGGAIVITPSNPLSLCSKLTWAFRIEFKALGVGNDPADITVLKEGDLRHIALDSGRTRVAFAHRHQGRISETGWRQSKFVSMGLPRTFSGHLLGVGLRPLESL